MMTDPHIQNEPVQPAWSYVGLSNAMNLPGARDSDIAGLDREFVCVYAEIKSPAFQVTNLNSFIAMPGQSPRLFTVGIPVAQTRDARQDSGIESMPGVVSARERRKLNLAISNSLDQRTTGICKIPA